MVNAHNVIVFSDEKVLAQTWMNLTDKMNRRNWTLKSTYYVIPFI